MTNCYFCGKELPQGSNHCASCDHETITENPFEKPYKKRPYLWYLLPIFTGIVGGVIAYIIIKKNEPKTGKYCLIIGGAVTVVGIILNWTNFVNIFNIQM